MRSIGRFRRGGSVLLALAASTAPIQGQDPGRVLRQRSVYEDMQLFSQVLNQLRVNHPDSLDTHTLMMAAIEGMVRAADPHSYVLPAMRLSPEKQEAYASGKLHPLPIDFTYVDDAPLVLAVRPGTQASTLGILPGDELLRIDGQPVTAESPAELDIVLSGEKGSTVTLVFQREQTSRSTVFERTVKREELDAATAVVASFMLDSLTGYLRLSHFRSDEVADEFHDKLADLERRGMQRLVLDLRDNGGGSVEQAAKVTGEFLPRGALIYTAEGVKEEVAEEVTVHRSFFRSEKRFPTVVLVNAGTASAAELLAGALQDHDRALIVGQPTFGKSLLMQSFPMTDGSVIVLTIGRVRTPCGRVVQRPYRGIRYRDYMRGAGAVADTTDRPSCRTAGGRRVWGGGGIYPDVILPTADSRPPDWFDLILEQQLGLRWAGGHVSTTDDAAESVSQLAQSTLPVEVVQDFLRFATDQGLTLPEDAADHAMLRGMLKQFIAWVRWGESGLYTLAAMHDASVAAAVEQFARADSILR